MLILKFWKWEIGKFFEMEDSRYFEFHRDRIIRLFQCEEISQSPISKISK